MCGPFLLQKLWAKRSFTNSIFSFLCQRITLKELISSIIKRALSMSQRPHLGSISSSPGETRQLAKLTGHPATTEKRGEVQKMHMKLFPTSFNILSFTTHPRPYHTSWYLQHPPCLLLSIRRLLLAIPSRSFLDQA